MTGPEVGLDALLSALNAHDLDAISALAPGNERFRESHRRMLTAFPDVYVDAEWTVADGHKAVAWGHITGTHGGEWRSIGPTGARSTFGASSPSRLILKAASPTFGSSTTGSASRRRSVRRSPLRPSRRRPPSIPRRRSVGGEWIC